MAGQSPDRRHVLEMLATAAAASQFPGFSKWVFAAEHQHSDSGTVAPRPASYRPHFFSEHEYRTLELLSELIIPADESPGAKDAGVSEFIDFMAAHGDRTLQTSLRSGLHWIDGKARQVKGKAMINLAPSEQEDLLRSVAYKGRVAAGDEEGHSFFLLIRRYTVIGFYTSRVGMRELNYPGLQFYSQTPECPHKDDPEHRHLPAPRY